MITRPSEYKHTNESLAFADSDNIRGGGRVVANLAELYALSNIPDKLKQNVTIVRVLSEDANYILIDKTKASLAEGWKVNSSKDEVYVGMVEPVDSSIKIWGKTTLTDIDILKSIVATADPAWRSNKGWTDQNPVSSWSGVTLNANNRITRLDMISYATSSKVTTLNGLDKMKLLEYLTLSFSLPNDPLMPILKLVDMPNLATVRSYGHLSEILISNSPLLTELTFNQDSYLSSLNVTYTGIVEISSLNSFSSALQLDVRHNKLSLTETDRLINAGFSNDKVLPQNP